MRALFGTASQLCEVVVLESRTHALRLERLDLSFCSHISDEGLLGLSSTLPQLRLLSLAHCPDVTEVVRRLYSEHSLLHREVDDRDEIFFGFFAPLLKRGSR
jgi:hypothetical protein